MDPAEDEITRQQILDAFGVSQEEVDALDTDGSYQRATEEAAEESEAFKAAVLARAASIAAEVGATRRATYESGRITISGREGQVMTTVDQPTRLWDAGEVDRLLADQGYQRQGSWTVRDGGTCAAEVRWTGQPG